MAGVPPERAAGQPAPAVSEARSRLFFLSRPWERHRSERALRPLQVRFWDGAALQPARAFRQDWTVESVSFCPAKGRFAAGGEDMWVHLYDYATGEELECNKGPRPPCSCTQALGTLRRQAPLRKRTQPDSEAYREGLWASGRTCPGQADQHGDPARRSRQAPLPAVGRRTCMQQASDVEPACRLSRARAAPAQATMAPCTRCALRRTARRMRRAPRMAPSGCGAPTGRAPRTASPTARERRVACLSSGRAPACDGKGRLCGARVHVPGTAAGGAKSSAVPGFTLFVWRGVLRRSQCYARGAVRCAVACFATAWNAGDACRSQTLETWWLSELRQLCGAAGQAPCSEQWRVRRYYLGRRVDELRTC